MELTQRIERFVEAKKSETDKHHGDSGGQLGALPFVTVSSQSGAGGGQLTVRLLDLLANEDSAKKVLQGWRLFDKSMCRHVLEEAHTAESMNELLNEEYHSQIQEFVLGLYGDRGMQNVAYVRLAKLLRTLGSIGKVIIPGHGGNMATRELAGGVHVRLVAPLPLRAARLAPVLGVDEDNALQQIRQRDTEQRKMLKTHYRVDNDDAELYDLVCNTERMSIETVAGLVMAVIHERVG